MSNDHKVTQGPTYAPTSSSASIETPQDITVGGLAAAGTDPRQDALLDTIVTLRVGPSADEETRKRERELIVEAEQRIARRMLEHLRASVARRDALRHG